MTFFIFLLIILFLLITITIATTIIKVSLLITTKYKYETYILIIPAILYIILWLALLLAWFFTVDHFSQNGIINIIFDNVLNIQTSYIPYNLMIVCGIIYCFIGIILQTFIFLCINIPYNKIRMNISKLLKNEHENTQNRKEDY